MTERPTPRTDFESEVRTIRCNPREIVDADFARQLERELAEAEDEIARLNQSLKSASSIYDEAKEQRDRLKSALEDIAFGLIIKRVAGGCGQRQLWTASQFSEHAAKALDSLA